MSDERPLILVTNDDGVRAEGVRALADGLASVGEVVTVAPDREMSGAGHSVTLRHPLRVTKIDDRRYAVDGTPTDCVLLGSLSVLPRKPDLLVSGINRGANLGDDVTYSGTVAAACEGTLLGIPSFSISVVDTVHTRFDVAASFAAKLAKHILGRELPADTLLNVNVPNLPASEIKGVDITRQGKHVYRDQVIEKKDPRGQTYYWIAGTIKSNPVDGTDLGAVSQNRISITPLHLNLTSDEFLDELRGWNINI
ncbi:MAG: 5'/3'-nucleotidase SurE [Candidatus Hydrogenedentes bacterium]|nr:5'/3'-nucleotidase SurE [Candidatus Hydrogenedentota bacterium]